MGFMISAESLMAIDNRPVSPSGPTAASAGCQESGGCGSVSDGRHVTEETGREDLAWRLVP